MADQRWREAQASHSLTPHFPEYSSEYPAYPQDSAQRPHFDRSVPFGGRTGAGQPLFEHRALDANGVAGSGQRHQNGARRHLYGAAGTALILGGALGYVGLVDPHSSTSLYPQCLFKLLTGWNCPACGGLRMTHDLLHGDLAASINDNVFLLVGIPILAVWFLFRRFTSRRSFPVAMSVMVALSVIAWTVLRNLPGFPLLPTVLGG